MSRLDAIVNAYELADTLDMMARWKLCVKLSTEPAPSARMMCAILLRMSDPWNESIWKRSSAMARRLAYDSDAGVRHEAAVSYAVLADDEASTALSLLRHDPRPGVRLASTLAIGAAPTPEEAVALRDLVVDVDVEVRRWASFMLASMVDAVESLVVEDGLVTAAVDADLEVRGEALVGLAKVDSRRKQVIRMLSAELGADRYSDWSLEAASIIGGPEVLRLLESLRVDLEYRGLHEEVAGVESVIADVVRRSG